MDKKDNNKSDKKKQQKYNGRQSDTEFNKDFDFNENDKRDAANMDENSEDF